MTQPRKLVNLSRQELYDLIWTTPTAQVAAEFGVTDTTVKNHCNNRNVPRPSKRYWTRFVAGLAAKRKPLPPSAQEVFEIEAQRPISNALALPDAGVALHPLATELLARLNKTKPDDRKLIQLKEIEFPEITVTKALTVRAAQAFHVILTALEPLGIEFRKYPGKYEPGYFKWGNDRMFVEIEETLLDMAGAERTNYWWQCRGECRPAGHLAITCNGSPWRRGEEQEWRETRTHSLERVLSEAVSCIRSHFLKKQRQRIQDAIDRKNWQVEQERRRREWEAAEVIRKQKEKERAHAKAIAAMSEERKSDLVKATEWWERSSRIQNYINACERNWRGTTAELNTEQVAWLTWAREIATQMSPFTAGYPDPAKHGPFDATIIPFGGPYPPAQQFPEPR